MEKRFSATLPRMLYILSFLLSVLLILIFYSRQEGWYLDALFNSDILYFPTLFKDLFIDHYRPEGWYVPGAPGFFPDMTLYFIIMAVTGPTVISAFLYSIIQFLLIMLLFNMVVRIIQPDWNFFMLALVNGLFSLIVLAGLNEESFLITFHVLSNTYHLGVFVNTLLALVFSFCFLRYGKNLYIWLLLALVILAVLSDRLFLVLYVLPFLLALVPWIRKNNIVMILKLAGAVILGVAAGMIALRQIRLHSGIVLHKLYSDVSMEKITSSFQVLMGHMKSFILKWNLFSFILIGSVFFTAGLIVMVIAARKEYVVPAAVHRQRSLHLIFLLFSLLFMMVVFWTPVLLGDYAAWSKIRYNIFVFYYALLALIPVLSLFRRYAPVFKRLIPYSAAVLVAVLVILSGIKSVNRDFGNGLRRYFGYYPEVARCMDAMKEKYPLKHGVSKYWQAKVGTLFSRQQVRLYSVFDANLVPYRHVCNENWFYRTGYGRYDPPVFNFVIFPVDEPLDPLYNYFGEPVAREVCGDFVFLLVSDFVYNRGQPLPELKEP